MERNCSNCYHAGPGDVFECFDCWDYSNWIDICAYSKEKKGVCKDEMARKAEQDGDDRHLIYA